VAQIGAVIGREFSHALLAAVARETGPELASALDRLRAARLLFRQGEPPHATYLFKHALVQDAAYGTLLREPRRALHARIADALESRFTGIAESQPELLARHCTEAGLVQKAAALWGKAGLEAHALWFEFWSGNYVTAGRLVEQGVVLADEKRAMHWKTLGMIGCGCLFSVTGDASNALQMLTSGIAAYRSTGATVWMPMILSHLARTYAALDKLDEALH
jgi:hypothetical protein